MKNVFKVSLVALLLLSLTACSAVFDSAISGTVKDKNANATSSTTTGGIADVMVYAYDNADTWNNKFNAWDGKSEFMDYSVPSARTTQDGSFSISNLRWKTLNSTYGKDADCKTYYLLAFHKDYGLVKVDGRTVQSDKSNNFGIIDMEKVSATKTLTISLKDIDDNTSTSTGRDATITDTTGFTFKYSYADGYSVDKDGNYLDNVTGTVNSFTNGKATITVKYNENNLDKAPSVTIYDVQTGSDWDIQAGTLDESGKKVIKYNATNKEYSNTDLNFSNSWKTVTVNLSLLDGSSANQDKITDPIYFKWEYNNGEEVKNGNVTTTNGSATVNVKFKKNYTAPTLTLTAFDDNDTTDDKWTWTEDENNAKARTEGSKLNVTLSTDKDSVTQKVYFRKNYITLPKTTGISGYLISSTSGTTAAPEGGLGYKEDLGDNLILKLGDKVISTNSVRTSQEIISTSSTGNTINYGHFSGLANGAKLPVTYDESGSTVDYKGNDITLTVAWKKGSAASNTYTDVATKIVINSMTSDFDNYILEK